uniref:VOC domain-containing protein n=1 Tax=Heterorhabditis bacteriophora TaxID=37862 RepID=A0A1I7XV15_HETBA
MKAWLITNQDHKVQVTLAEGVKGRKGKSQIEEFVEFNGGPGIQHIALLVDDIIATVTEMKKRSTEFLTVPETYFDMLNERLQKSKLNCKEDLNKMTRTVGRPASAASLTWRQLIITSALRAYEVRVLS